MQTVLYARVSTTEQTIAHQTKQAKRAGLTIDHVVADDGVSAVSTRLVDRPQGRRLFDMLRRGDVLVVRWVDRLGRNYADVTDTIREFMRQGVTIKAVINGMVFDGATTAPMQMAVRDALIGFMAASAQAQAEAAKEAQDRACQGRAAERLSRPETGFHPAAVRDCSRHDWAGRNDAVDCHGHRTIAAVGLWDAGRSGARRAHSRDMGEKRSVTTILYVFAGLAIAAGFIVADAVISAVRRKRWPMSLNAARAIARMMQAA